jgi:hypothetical protein
MSFPALRTVASMVDFPLDHSARLVLFALANRHNKISGLCCPGQASIARDAGVSKNSVTRALQALVSAQLIKIIPQGGRANGGRRADAYVFLFPLLKAEDDDFPTVGNSPTPDIPTVDLDIPMVERDIPTTGSKPGSNQEKNQDSVGKEADSPTVDFGAATELLWKAASDKGRQRSSKGDIDKALRAAVKREPLERIMRGMGAYFRSDEASKDDGEFQKGIHRMIQNDRWSGYLDDEAARVSKGESFTEELQQARDQAGTVDAPSEQRQNLWMELFTQGMPWDSERGPQPGRLGCRVAPEIQRKWGITPFGVPSADADSAAFD